MSGLHSKISVAVTTRARPHYLELSLRSILAQTLRPAEIVVSEDGEDPQTAAVIERASAEGIPIRHERHVPPLNERGNRRHALATTRCGLVALLDDDDEWEPEFLEVASRALAAHPECGFAMADHWLIDADGRILADASEASSNRFGRDRLAPGVHDDVLALHLTAKTMTLVTSLFRRNVLEEMDFVPPGPSIAPDFSLFVELGARRVGMVYVAQRLGRYRVHSGRATSGKRIERGESVTFALARLATNRDLSVGERKQLGALFRSTTIETAIAFAHAGMVRSALRTLRRFGEQGWGMPSARRVVVLSAALAGIRRR